MRRQQKANLPFWIPLALALIAVPVGDASHRQIVGADLDLDPIAGHDSDVVHSHLSAYVGQHFQIALIQLDAKTSVGKILDNRAIEFDSLLLSRLIS